MGTLAQTMAAESDLVLRHQTIAPLTTVERVLAWLNPDQGTLVTPQAQRDLIAFLITAVSGLALQQMNRDTLARSTRTETYASTRVGRLLLRHWPVLSVSSVRVSPALADMDASLYSLEVQGSGAQRLVAAPGAGFLSDRGGVTVVYETGFVQVQRVSVPSSGPYTAQASSRLLADEGVVNASGGVVSSSLYSISSSGLYTFDASLAGQKLSLVYSYVPEDIEQVVVEETALAYRSRSRIGEQSKALPNGGGTSSYAPRQLTQISQDALNPYRRVVPS